jgi:plastocyanin
MHSHFRRPLEGVVRDAAKRRVIAPLGFVAVCVLMLSGLTGMSAAATRATAKAGATTTVRVVTTEYRFALSRKTVPVGTVVFVIVNKGQLSHNMAFNGPLIYRRAPLVDPGSSYRFKVVFKRAGIYHFVCSPHFKLGMASQIRVTK